MHNSCSSTGFVEMIWTALAQDTPLGTMFNMLMLLHSQHSSANLFHITFFPQQKSTFAMEAFSVKVR